LTWNQSLGDVWIGTERSPKTHLHFQPGRVLLQYYHKYQNQAAKPAPTNTWTPTRSHPPVTSLLSKLPDDCSLEDIQYHLYVIEKVYRGLEAAATQGTIPQEEAQKRLSQWLIK